jgi:hypothetical protein
LEATNHDHVEELRSIAGFSGDWQEKMALAIMRRKTYSLCIPLLMPMADLRSSAQIGLRISQLYRQILRSMAALI